MTTHTFPPSSEQTSLLMDSQNPPVNKEKKTSRENFIYKNENNVLGKTKKITKINYFIMRQFLHKED